MCHSFPEPKMKCSNRLFCLTKSKSKIDLIYNLTINERNLCLSVFLSVCPSIISTTVHPVDFIRGGCIAEDPRRCSVECDVVWMSQAIGLF